MRKVRAIFYITSSSDELSIKSIKDILPFEPTRQWQKGDQMYNLNGIIPGGKYRRSNWAFEGIDLSTITIKRVEDAIIPLANLFQPYKKQLQQIRKMGFETSICIVISGEKLPMAISQNCIELLYELGVDIDFDTYIYE